jgi:hypothetical protein
MSRQYEERFWVEIAGSGVGAVLLGATLVWPSWIEAVFGVDPDDGSGLLEWLIVVSSLIVSACAVALARREWRRGIVSGTQIVEGAGPGPGWV